MRKFLFALYLAILHLAAMAIEEPHYKVVQQLDGADTATASDRPITADRQHPGRPSSA